MKRLLIGIFSAALAAQAAVAAPIPIYENFGDLVTGTNDPPQVDALAFANYGVFVVNTILPYDFTDVLSYTNRGTMESLQGFIFDTAFSLGKRVPAQNFVNASGATIRADEGFSLGFGPLSQQAIPSLLSVAATNITIQGILSVAAGGLLRLDGDNVNLNRAGLEVRRIQPSFNSLFLTETNFYPDVGITDLYWAETNDFMFVAPILDVSIVATNVNVPLHGVTNGNGFVQRTSFRLTNPLSYAQTNRVTETNWLVQAAFVSVTDPNIFANVRMAPSQIITNLYKSIILQLAMPESNVVTGDIEFNFLYLQDQLAWNTNYNVLSNVFSSGFGTFRPAAYILSRSQPNDWAIGAPPTGALTPDLLYGPGLSNNLVTNLYAAYQADISTIPVEPPRVPGFDFTNLPGRVEIKATDLNLSRTRIRGNAMVNIDTPNLLSSTNSIIDSPNLNFNLGAIQRVLTVTNLAQESVSRFTGQLRAWSAVWTNYSGFLSTNVEPDATDPTLSVTNIITNVVEIGYHAFVVDAGGLQTRAPVVTYDLKLHAPDVVLADSVNVTRSLFIDADSFTMSGNLTLISPLEFWRGSNAPAVKFFTNTGSLFVPNGAYFVEGRSNSYSTFVNRGSIDASGMTLRTDYFEHRGSIGVSSDGLHVDMVSGRVEGGTISSARDVVFNADDLKLFNSTNSIQGSLILNVTGGLADSGLGSDNFFTVRNGFFLNTKPQAGDLLGTSIRTIAPRFSTIQHAWASQDQGTNVAGFRDNAALGRLVLDGAFDSVLRFGPAAGTNALYVDLLVLTNNVLAALQNGDLGAALEIDPDMTIYFAASNVPAEELNNQIGGRLIWVQDFLGPYSAVDVLHRDGRIEQMNRAVRESPVIDSDADGLANTYDAFPLDPDTAPALTSLGLTTPPPTVSFKWEAKPRTVYRVEDTPVLGGGDWTFLKNYTNSATTATFAVVQDRVPSGSVQRYYRVQAIEQLK